MLVAEGAACVGAASFGFKLRIGPSDQDTNGAPLAPVQ